MTVSYRTVVLFLSDTLTRGMILLCLVGNFCFSTRLVSFSVHVLKKILNLRQLLSCEARFLGDLYRFNILMCHHLLFFFCICPGFAARGSP